MTSGLKLLRSEPHPVFLAPAWRPLRQRHARAHVGTTFVNSSSFRLAQRKRRLSSNSAVCQGQLPRLLRVTGRAELWSQSELATAMLGPSCIPLMTLLSVATIGITQDHPSYASKLCLDQLRWCVMPNRDETK